MSWNHASSSRIQSIFRSQGATGLGDLVIVQPQTCTDHLENNVGTCSHSHEMTCAPVAHVESPVRITIDNDLGLCPTAKDQVIRVDSLESSISRSTDSYTQTDHATIYSDDNQPASGRIYAKNSNLQSIVRGLNGTDIPLDFGDSGDSVIDPTMLEVGKGVIDERESESWTGSDSGIEVGQTFLEKIMPETSVSNWTAIKNTIPTQTAEIAAPQANFRHSSQAGNIRIRRSVKSHVSTPLDPAPRHKKISWKSQLRLAEARRRSRRSQEQFADTYNDQANVESAIRPKATNGIGSNIERPLSPPFTGAGIEIAMDFSDLTPYFECSPTPSNSEMVSIGDIPEVHNLCAKIEVETPLVRTWIFEEQRPRSPPRDDNTIVLRRTDGRAVTSRLAVIRERNATIRPNIIDLEQDSTRQSSEDPLTKASGIMYNSDAGIRTGKINFRHKRSVREPLNNGLKRARYLKRSPKRKRSIFEDSDDDWDQEYGRVPITRQELIDQGTDIDHREPGSPRGVPISNWPHCHLEDNVLQ